AMLPVVAAAGGARPDAGSALALTLAIAAEASIGVLLGLLAQLVFGAVTMAGELAGVQMGLGLIGLIDPQSHDRVVALAQWQNALALLLFLAIDGHHALIQALAESFRRVPVGGAALTGAALGMALAFAGELFVLALKLAAPVLVLVLMTNACMGALAKLIPQLNVMVVGFPINVAAGFFILAAAQPFTLRLLEGAFARTGAVLGGVVAALV
ncbi:MAG: flagellar biosynthetic protein FliR, partial [Thermodesulfobacteriota bacterium]